MGLLKQAEDTIGGLFKGAPKLSGSTKETVVKVFPWLALIGGILQLWSALSLWRWASVTNEASEFLRAIGASNIVDRWTVWVWVLLAFLVVEGALLLMAFPKLQKRAKAGWDILLLVSLINLGYAVFSLFVDGYGFAGGFGSLLWNVIVSAVVFWLLFAVRDKYKGADFKVGS